MKRMTMLFIIVTELLISCNNYNCTSKFGFELDSHLFSSIKVNGNTYCELVNGAFLGDELCIANLLKVDVKDFASYQHGAVLIELIDKIGEVDFLNKTAILSRKEKKNIYYSIKAGLEFIPNIKYHKKHLHSIFPLISKKLNLL
ncbi:hypothetical protein ACFSX9_00365 [Flavobacterium ardleyense]|uniref:Lipoprotein n=1 Tax=Flavobacterium ardleyense TaxID=2038737 RepID=A0ABW5Z4U7_9FLAO